jgi:hypothetical protein
MKTATICFDGVVDEYNRDKQLRSILNETKEPFGFLCKDYDEMDALMPILKEKGVTKVVLLHEDSSYFSRFVQAATEEYGHLFKSIEVWEENFHRLHEAVGGVPGGGGNSSTPAGLNTNAIKGGTASSEEAIKRNVIIYSANPSVKGVQIPKNLTMQDSTLVQVCSLDCNKTGLWNFSALSLNSLRKSGGGKNDMKFAFARTAAGLFRLGNGIITNIYCSQYIESVMKFQSTYQQMYPQASNQLTIKQDETFGSSPAAAQLGVQAFAIGSKILQSPAKPDLKKVEEWESGERIHLAGFLIKALGDIQAAIKMGNKDETNPDGKSLVDKILEKFGFYEDLKTMNNNLRNGGMALLMDAASLVASELGKKKERKEKESDKFLSHPDFENFAKCFTDKIDNSDGEFIEGNA